MARKKDTETFTDTNGKIVNRSIVEQFIFKKQSNDIQSLTQDGFSIKLVMDHFNLNTTNKEGTIYC